MDFGSQTSARLAVSRFWAEQWLGLTGILNCRIFATQYRKGYYY